MALFEILQRCFAIFTESITNIVQRNNIINNITQWRGLVARPPLDDLN